MTSCSSDNKDNSGSSSGGSSSGDNGSSNNAIKVNGDALIAKIKSLGADSNLTENQLQDSLEKAKTDLEKIIATGCKIDSILLSENGAKDTITINVSGVTLSNETDFKNNMVVSNANKIVLTGDFFISYKINSIKSQDIQISISSDTHDSLNFSNLNISSDNIVSFDVDLNITKTSNLVINLSFSNGQKFDNVNVNNEGSVISSVSGHVNASIHGGDLYGLSITATVKGSNLQKISSQGCKLQGTVNQHGSNLQIKSMTFNPSSDGQSATIQIELNHSGLSAPSRGESYSVALQLTDYLGSCMEKLNFNAQYNG